MTCRTCKFLVVPEGERRMNSRLYKCSAPFPEVKLPDSFRSHLTVWPPRQSMMCPEYGENCPTHEPIKKGKP